MIHIVVPHDLLILLRAMLLLGPLALTYYFGWRRRHESRVLVGGLFSFLYGIGLLLPAHIVAMQFGYWSYGDSALMFFGMPADIWFAGALLFGPAIFFAWPDLNPWVLTIAFVVVQGLVFHSLAPFVIAGNGWFLGVLLVFLTVHIPALYLARWVARDICLAERASLLALGYGFLAYFVLPSVIMQAMGGSWDFAGKSTEVLIITMLAMLPCIIIGLAAVQMFVVHGEGTPIPLDKTKHLVRSGIYAYLCNPMQCATALSWIILGLFLQNIFIMLASGMAVVFVLGMVRWHQRSDLEVRFPEGWPEYRAHVPEWLPRWRPWVKHTSTLHYNDDSVLQRKMAAWISKWKVIGLTLELHQQPQAIYMDGNRGVLFTGWSAWVCTLFHNNFLTALLGSALLLILLPAKWLSHKLNTSGTLNAPWLLGVDSLLAIRKDSLGFYNQLHTTNKDAIRLRLGPYRCWFLFHPDLIEQVLAKQADAFIRFEKMMDILRQWNGESLLIAEGDSWKERRRKVLSAFKQQRLPEYAQTILKSGQALRDQWCETIKTSGEYRGDIDADMAAHSLDIAALTLFGEPLHSKAFSIGEAVHALSELAFKETTSAFVLPDFLPLPSKRHKREVIKTMRGAIRDIVTTRLAGKAADRGDLLSMLIEHHDGNQQAIEEDSMSLLIAGHETSGATLTWLFILLAQHRDVLARVQQELNAVIGTGEVDFSVLQSLPYLSAVTQEAMRLYPAAYALFSRRAVKDVDAGNGIHIRRGDLVQILPYITQRDARWFEEPESFKPERFLSKSYWPRYAYIPFGAGQRVCIGQSFGFMEVVLTAAMLLQKLEPWPLSATFTPSPRFSLRPKAGAELTWKLRK